ncbi:MAG: hypothetical protein IPM24_23685 [Bryobacterales bacterium]|nr:hypothetical protein [Bryobacterales bacterium]
MPLQARRHVRRMRGGAQAQLIQTDTGDWYVVKYRDNPQHRRVVINEIVTAELARYLRLPSPEAAIIRIDSEFFVRFPEAAITAGGKSVTPATGRHFGSRFPGDPAHTAVYDFVPDLLLNRVANRVDFLGALVLDKWICNADARQAIFVREEKAFHALFIDHGFAFNGPHWEFPDGPLMGLYLRKAVYEGVTSIGDFEPWLSQVESMPETVADAALRRIPGEWFDGDGDELERLLEKLWKRRRRVRDLLADCREARLTVFPNWR